MQETKPDCNGVPYNVSVYGTQVISQEIIEDTDAELEYDVNVNMTYTVQLGSSDKSIGAVSVALAAALPREMVAYGNALNVSELQRYPGYDGELDIAGRLGAAGYPDNSLRVYGILSGVGDSTTGGIRIHEGYTCGAPGAYLANAAGLDPGTTTFSSDQFGIAEVNALVEGMSLSNVTGRTVVIQDSEGLQVACGIISYDSPGELCTCQL